MAASTGPGAAVKFPVPASRLPIEIGAGLGEDVPPVAGGLAEGPCSLYGQLGIQNPAVAGDAPEEGNMGAEFVMAGSRCPDRAAQGGGECDQGLRADAYVLLAGQTVQAPAGDKADVPLASHQVQASGAPCVRVGAKHLRGGGVRGVGIGEVESRNDRHPLRIVVEGDVFPGEPGTQNREIAGRPETPRQHRGRPAGFAWAD